MSPREAPAAPTTTRSSSESHDEILFNGGDGEIVVAVDCDPEGGGTLVTVVAEGLEPGVYEGVFDPTPASI